MILERTNFMDMKDIEKQLEEHFPIDKNQMEELKRVADIYQLCQAGANEVGTKLENLDAEFQFKYSHNPIHYMEERMKAFPSLVGKLRRKKLPLTSQSIKDHIFDVAGIRVITNYIDDIFRIEDSLVNQSDITLIRRKNYVAHPKTSGYRSLHLIVSVPVFEAEGARDAIVEVQIRTVGMEMWASLEHQLRYKTDIDRSIVDQYSNSLVGYSDQLNLIELKMQEIFKHLNGLESYQAKG